MLHIQDICVMNGDRSTQLSSDLTRRTDCLEYKVDQLLRSARLQAHSVVPPQNLSGPSPATNANSSPEASHSQEDVRPQMSHNPFATGPQAAFCVKASIGRRKCPRFCRCRCHLRTQLSTPRWMQSVFGTFFGSFTGCPIPGVRACDYSRCHQAGASSTQVLYIFPGWFVQRAVMLSTTWRNLSGPGASWTLRMSRLVSDSADIWYYVRLGSLSQVRNCLEDGTASLHDVDTQGSTLLHVRMNHLNIPPLTTHINLLFWPLYTGIQILPHWVLFISLSLTL